jgi:hypothetical protein
MVMDKILISKKDLYEWCNNHMDVHSDWTGKRVETIDKMESVEDFVNKLYNYLEGKYR